MTIQFKPALLPGGVPFWVESDPFKSRAVDALGFGNESDDLANRLLPGISVLTTRARYFTFLCWARQQIGKRHDEDAIHRIEIDLVRAEAALGADHFHTCSYIGSEAREKLLADNGTIEPRSVYKSPVWRAYRASMRGLGLAGDSPNYVLTPLGTTAGRYFMVSAARRYARKRVLSKKACLSCISDDERTLLRSLLGLSHKGVLDDSDGNSVTALMRRARTLRVLKPIYKRDGYLAGTNVLPLYAILRRPGLREPLQSLRASSIWAHLTLGVNAAFMFWARAVESRIEWRFEKRLASALGKRYQGVPVLDGMTTEDPCNDGYLERAVHLVRWALTLRDGLKDLGAPLMDSDGYEFARIFEKTKRPRQAASAAIEALFERHITMKGPDAWLEEKSGRYAFVREGDRTRKLPERVLPASFRMGAMASIASDLGWVYRA